MTEPPETPAEPPLILSPATARRRFLAYFGLKLVGLAALLGGVFLGRDGVTLASVVLLAIGGGALFVRPRHLGLTTKP